MLSASAHIAAELQEAEATHSAAAADWAQQLQHAVQATSSASTPALFILQVLMAAPERMAGQNALHMLSASSALWL